MSRRKHRARKMTDGFEVDKGPTGRVKINVVSIANLIALLGLLGTALGAWNSLSSKVDVLNVRVDAASNSVRQARSDLTNTIVARDLANRELNNKVELIGNRLTAVETILQRVEAKLNNPATIPR